MWRLRSRTIRLPLLLFLTVAVVGASVLVAQRLTVSSQRVSAFGQYRGYTSEIYDGTTRKSNYLALSDGTRLAYDLILPTRGGVVADQALPTLFQYTPYLRTFTIFDTTGTDLVSDLMNFGWEERAFLRVRSWINPQGKLGDPLFRTNWLEPMVKHGYAVIVVEQPGTGASFGTQSLAFDRAAREGDEILNWIAAQPWSDGNIGMFGASWEAHNQLAIASVNNPHLKAIVPVAVSMDMYDSVVYRGGVYNKGFLSVYGESTSQLEAMITPVDGDDGTLLGQALGERHGAQLARAPEAMRDFEYRDSTSVEGENFWDHFALYPMVERVNHSGVAVYLATGWYDVFLADTLKWYDSLSVPKRLLVRPLDHSQLGTSQDDVDFAAELQRWFDFWLKGVDNGVPDELPIHYYVIGSDKESAWRSAEQWPPAQAPTRLYLGGGRTGTITSANDGTLQAQASFEGGTRDTYLVNADTTTGSRSRWTAVERPHQYSDMRTNDAKALTYTTGPLPASTQIIGHPVLHLWLSSTTSDADVFAYLEEVNSDGSSEYITEGTLRASHRALSAPPYDNLALPYHSFFASAAAPLSAESPVELTFDLLPSAYRFAERSRVRLTLAFADKDNFESPILEPGAAVTVWSDPSRMSYLEVPIVE